MSRPASNLEARTLANATDADLSRWQAENLQQMARPTTGLTERAHYQAELRLISSEMAHRAASRQRERRLIAALLCAGCLLLGFSLGFSLGLYYARSTCQQVEVTR